MTNHAAAVAVLGGGRWARALVGLLRQAAAQEPDRISRLLHYRPPGASVADPAADGEAAKAGGDSAIPISALGGVDVLVLAVPVVAVRPLLRQAAPHLHGAQQLLHAIGSLASAPGDDPQTATAAGIGALSISEVVRAETPIRRVGALAGPALAQDLEERRPAALVCGSRFDDVCNTARHVLSTPSLRIYTTRDLIGVEVARATVAVVALCGGIAAALNLGVAARAILIARGAAELARLGVALGGQEKTFYGLAGVGEMVVATDGRGSADFELGRLLIEGVPIAAAQARIGRICDGPSMVREANRLAAQHRLRLPLCAGVEKLLNGEASPSVVLAKLLTSDNHAE